MVKQGSVRQHTDVAKKIAKPIHFYHPNYKNEHQAIDLTYRWDGYNFKTIGEHYGKH
jgi:hypothetical protein